MTTLLANAEMLFPARAQMTLTLMFHITFAAVGIGLPLLIVIAHRLHLRTGKAHYLELSKKWTKTTGLLFAVGAVSGTALSFELGLLWPKYMEIIGASVGHLFALEGFAFFLEAIFLGLYLYGRDRMSPRAHWWCAVAIAFFGALSGWLVLGVNAWMQIPVGVKFDANLNVIESNPYAIFATYAWFTMALHSTLACYMAVAFAVASVYAIGILRGRRDEYHFSGLRIAMTVGVISALLQPISGDLIAKFVHKTQPTKLAAMESHFETRAYAPMVIGGWPNMETREVRFAIEIPGMLSFLATGDRSATITGLNDIPRELWPNVPIVHTAFQIMVGLGVWMMLLAVIWAALRIFKRTKEEGRWLLRALAITGPAGFIALQAGWFVTEVGRQPWVIQDVLKTADTVTPSPYVWQIFISFAILYALLAVVTVILLRYLARKPA